ncbi:MAG: GTP-binding protein [Roseburia sp.]
MHPERERGITIKRAGCPVSSILAKDGEEYIFNLIRYTGTCRFPTMRSAEASGMRCDGAILVVDAARGN